MEMSAANLQAMAESLVQELRRIADYKRALVLDTSKTELDYQQAHEEWKAVYQDIFAWSAADKTLSMLFFLDEQRNALGDDAYYAGVVKILMSKDGNGGRWLAATGKYRSDL
ncbi:hypothetical protein ACFQUU_27020 [Herbaspirillum sp. GCM10030257]|uniref:hypothetical protein n=1 Tax=Herbaspirillum sp. GCM10030257 TaxID=3273393 RepID=UPI00360B9449